MGCHTWFYRILSKEEIEYVRKNKELSHVEELLGSNSFEPNLEAYRKIMDSIEKNTPLWKELS